MPVLAACLYVLAAYTVAVPQVNAHDAAGKLFTSAASAQV